MSINNDTILPAVVAPTLASIREGNAYLAVGDTGIAVFNMQRTFKRQGLYLQCNQQYL